MTRAAHLKRCYGLLESVYQALLEEQNGVCAVCGETNPVYGNHRQESLCVDHDRKCCAGSVSCGSCIRGLLCHRCNLALGSLKDDPRLIKRLLDYVVASRRRNGIPAEG